MKCMMCESLSLTHICSSCQEKFLQPQIYKRNIQNTQVISFYKYKEIKKLLHTKHTDLGYHLFNILAKNSFQRFAKEFQYPYKVNSIAIDDKSNYAYSHTAILNKHLKSKNIEPLFNKLRANNTVNYSGKSKAFRLQNPRNFQLLDVNFNEVILIDDIITTGITLNEAILTLKQNGIKPLFCLTLADSSEANK